MIEKPIKEDVSELIMTSEKIREFSTDQRVIKFCKNEFKRIKRESAILLSKYTLENKIDISLKSIGSDNKSFKHYNMGKIEPREGKVCFKHEIIKAYKETLQVFIKDIYRGLIHAEDIDTKEELEKNKSKENCYYVHKNIKYEQIRNMVCDEGGDVAFMYKFNNADMPISFPTTEFTLQRVNIQIISTKVMFQYPTEYIFNCPICNSIYRIPVYKLIGTRGKKLCDGLNEFIHPVSMKPTQKICNTLLSPDVNISPMKDAFFYNINYDRADGSKATVTAISFNDYEPGFYEAVIYKIGNPLKTDTFHIIDVRPTSSTTFTLPERKDDENYLITLQKTFDEYILEKTGMNIYGLFPCKIALILQTLASVLDMRKIYNIQIAGDASTGKSTVLKYYSFLLNNHLNLSTNGLSISVPALRGTRYIVNLMDKEHKIITPGYLGIYKSIHIDEAGENKELVQNLKTFLLEDNYGYHRAGGTDISFARTAHINLSENLDYAHVGQYRGMIRKAYKDASFKIGNEEQEAWDENWDLHLPLYRYTNPYLRKIVKEKRLEYQQKQLFWIDGYDYPLHERFPFYFYLANEKDNSHLSEIIKGNVHRNTISETMRLMKALKTEDIIKHFCSLKEYCDSEKDVESFDKVDKILESYGLHLDSRMKIFYYNIVKLSRIINERLEATEMDYNLLRWILEKTNAKIDVADTANYKIEGPPDAMKQIEIDNKISDETKEQDMEFGLPSEEFKNV